MDSGPLLNTGGIIFISLYLISLIGVGLLGYVLKKENTKSIIVLYTKEYLGLDESELDGYSLSKSQDSDADKIPLTDKIEDHFSRYDLVYIHNENETEDEDETEDERTPCNMDNEDDVCGYNEECIIYNDDDEGYCELLSDDDDEDDDQDQVTQQERHRRHGDLEQGRTLHHPQHYE